MDRESENGKTINLQRNNGGRSDEGKHNNFLHNFHFFSAPAHSAAAPITLGNPLGYWDIAFNVFI